MSQPGIAANNPLLFSQGANPVCAWNGANCGTCYTLYGPIGSTTIMVTDCCAGYPGNPSCLSPNPPGDCDWCAANSHSHFDLDADSFQNVCGSISMGYCQLNSAIQVDCPSGFSAVIADATAIDANPANLSVPVIVGIVVGAVVGVALLVGIIVFLMKRSNQTEIV